MRAVGRCVGKLLAWKRTPPWSSSLPNGRRLGHERVELIAARIAGQLGQQIEDDATDAAAAIALFGRQQQRVQGDVHGFVILRRACEPRIPAQPGRGSFVVPLQDDIIGE